MDRQLYDKYSRQILFAPIGAQGQQRLMDSSAVLVGCGALGTSLANLMVRAGLGRLRIIDRDFVEESNLQRQTLFEESDAREALPKAVAAQRRLRAVNSSVAVEGVVADLTPGNAAELLSGFPLILDGTDNFETRYLVNDAAVSLGVPWIYGAVVASYGLTMTIRPGESACLACLLESGDARAAAGVEETCDTVGVLGAAVQVISAIQAAEALKLLTGNATSLHGRLISFDVWSARYQAIGVARRDDCRACARREFTYLSGQAQPHVTLCGRDSVQIHERSRQLDLPALRARLAATLADVRANEFLLRFRVPATAAAGQAAARTGDADVAAAAGASPAAARTAAGAIAGYEVTVFADGRAIVKGTRDPAVARSLYARYLGA